VYLARGITSYEAFTLGPDATRNVQATIYRTSDAYDGSPDRSNAPADTGATINHIQRTGILRVGYNASVIPFCYFNTAGALVGYVAYAYEPARSLNVRLVFIPFDWIPLEDDLVGGRFDIAMAGIYATTQRLSALSASEPAPMSWCTSSTIGSSCGGRTACRHASGATGSRDDPPLSRRRAGASCGTCCTG
jgi:ABC-type amino acid transport substrate-binding protein